MTDQTAPARDRLFALIASIPGSGSVDWCRPAQALLDEIAAAPAGHAPATDQAALRDLIAEALADATGARWPAQAFLTEADAVLSVLPAPADRAAVLRGEAALIRAHCPDHLDTDSAEGSWMDCHCPVADDIERRLAAAPPADEVQQPETQADCNSGVGWYEVVHPRNATTCIAYAHEDGSLYLPEGDDLTPDEFAFAAARGNAHRLVRADEAQQPKEA